jgi:type II secretory pathway component PulF
MKVFEFAAFDSSGKKKFGTVSARSLLQAKRKIRQRGFYLLSIKIDDLSVSYTRDSSSLFKELKEFFFSGERINIYK